jgi:hypothetical protein
LNQQPQPDLEKAKADLERLQSEMAASQRANDKLLEDLARAKHNSKVRLRVVAVVMMVAALVRLAWVYSDTPPAAQPVALPPVAASGPAAATAAVHSPDSVSKALDSPATQGLDRLTDAFRSMPDEDQVDLIAKINARNPGGPPACPLAWNDGVPSLSLGDKKGQAPSMSAALNQCAAAVEKYRLEKLALSSK